MNDLKELLENARRILLEWKGPSYAFGEGALRKVGSLVRPLGQRALVAVADLGQAWMGLPTRGRCCPAPAGRPSFPGASRRPRSPCV